MNRASSSDASSGSSGEESEAEGSRVGLLIKVSNLNSRPSGEWEFRCEVREGWGEGREV